MAPLAGDLALQVIFSRAFLVELERGNLERAAVFARAFLKHHAPRPAGSAVTAVA